jgi:spermidine/putrescine transport system permease protein
MSKPALLTLFNQKRPGNSTDHSPKVGLLYSSPMGLWLTLFFLLPVFLILTYSFLARGPRGGVVWEFSLEAFRSLANPVFLRVTIQTFVIAIISTSITMVLALPSGYYMARSGNKSLLMLVIIPFWVNFLIRVYAWIAILGREGMLNDLLRALGIIDQPIQFLFNTPTVILVHVYSYLPFAILPLYAAIEKFDFTLLEAARDLGSNHITSLIKILLPGIRGGLFASVLFTFIPTFGSYAIPDLVGGATSYMLGNIIANEVLRTRNWPLASAISVVITLVTSLALFLYFLLQRSSTNKQLTLVQEETGV